MEILRFHADSQRLVCENILEVTADIVGELYCTFTFEGDDWNKYAMIRAYFWNDCDPSNVKTVIVHSGEMLVPWEVMTEKGKVFCDIAGVILDENDEFIEKRLPSFRCKLLNITYKPVLDGTNSIPPTPSEVEQIMSLLAEKQDKLIAGLNIIIEDNVISAIGGGGASLWGYIQGELSDQTDLWTELNSKALKSDLDSYRTSEEQDVIDENIGSRIDSVESDLSASIENIEEKIPTQASAENQLADKDFVNSSIATNTANFIGTFDSVEELKAYSGTLTNNDYAFVQVTDSITGLVIKYDRYKWTTVEWKYEYTLNNSSFTSEQWSAINSGITALDVGKIRTALQPEALDDYRTATEQDIIDEGKQDTLKSGENIKTINGESILGEGDIPLVTETNWGDIGGEILEQEDLAEYLDQLKEKTEKVRIDIDVANKRFLKGSTVLNFAQLNNMLQNSPDFLVFVYEKREHRCTFIDMDSNPKQMRFVAPLVNDGFLKTQSIYVTSVDGVNITNMTVSDINSENSSNKRTNLDNPNNTTYPTTKAVSDVVDEINDELSTEKQAVRSLEDGKQDKLIAGDNITIDENNVISVSGGGGEMRHIATITVENEPVSRVAVSSDADGNPLELTELFIYANATGGGADVTTSTSDVHIAINRISSTTVIGVLSNILRADTKFRQDALYAKCNIAGPRHLWAGFSLGTSNFNGMVVGKIVEKSISHIYIEPYSNTAKIGVGSTFEIYGR